ncbi:indoleacetamide hydrolase [Hoeflea sp. CAU 1731]
MKNPTELGVQEAVHAMRSGALSSRALVDALIERCERHSDLGAFTAVDWRRLRDDADQADDSGRSEAPLHGVPLVIKDNINTAKLTTCAGSGALKDHVARSDASAVAQLFDAGALLGAKGNMHELAFGVTSNNAVTGAARNPYDQRMIPGGSSGGVAAAVAADLMPAGIGTDTGASVRQPAALCGVVGFRPTVGRYSSDGVVPISHTRDTVGPITKSVADARLLDVVMSGDNSKPANLRLSDLRIGVPRITFYQDLETDVASAAEAFLKALRDAGVTLIEAEIPELMETDEAVSFPVVLYEFMQDLPAYLKENGLDLTMEQICAGAGSPDVKGLIASLLGDGAIPEGAYRNAVDVARPKLRKLYADHFAEHRLDAVLFPTTPLTARPIGDDETVELNGARVPTFATFIRNTDPGSNAAIPGISIPVALSSTGLPIGMELDGPENSDSHLLDVAEMLEDIAAFSSKPKL